MQTGSQHFSEAKDYQKRSTAGFAQPIYWSDGISTGEASGLAIPYHPRHDLEAKIRWTQHRVR